MTMMIMLMMDMLCSLRALYGTDLRQNGIHCSSTCEEAQQEIRFFFHDSQFTASPSQLQQLCVQKKDSVSA